MNTLRGVQWICKWDWEGEEMFLDDSFRCAVSV